MGNNRNKPSILSIKDIKFSGPDDPVPGSWYTEIMNSEGFGGSARHREHTTQWPPCIHARAAASGV